MNKGTRAKKQEETSISKRTREKKKTKNLGVNEQRSKSKSPSCRKNTIIKEGKIKLKIKRQPLSNSTS